MRSQVRGGDNDKLCFFFFSPAGSDRYRETEKRGKTTRKRGRSKVAENVQIR